MPRACATSSASARPFVAPDDAARAKASAREGSAGAGTEEEVPTWRAGLIKSGSGAIKSVRENVVLALDGMPEHEVPGIEVAQGVVAFNEFTNDVIAEARPWGTPAGGGTRWTSWRWATGSRASTGCHRCPAARWKRRWPWY